ncbi:hypothetical protein B0A50_07755 [Salinomyces thailandicus]|uniref:tRNA (uracil-O(2)-)-methyltransferase n=1 Tax=Salinomyces thailandicus TaxID=706561 RepID=A0A4U0TMC0_9PEZI|nr:hypothetical protein B0A50_07755 [Salinomyces thailandica]
MAVETSQTNDAVKQTDTAGTKFTPTNLTASPPLIQRPNETWTTVLSSPCPFPPEIFHTIMQNLIKNPNITSSHLFRADIYYDSGATQPPSFDAGEQNDDKSFTRHLQPQYRPHSSGLNGVDGYEVTRTLVRELIPRNPLLDPPLLQTCHYLQKSDKHREWNTVLYVPHIDSGESMPFYHPAVAKVAFTHTWPLPSTPPKGKGEEEDSEPAGSISISYSLFKEDTQVSTKLERTALRLLQTLHKHGKGQLAGYEKRVHLDQVIPQKRYQDRYTKLKARFGRQLSEQWVEVTDPGKHVFEDLGIAAFLIELWGDMFDISEQGKDGEVGGATASGSKTEGKSPFPGFVDIGCGNGLLVHILLASGYKGWGFDARRRKTWSTLPATTQAALHQRLLVPEIFLPETSKDQENKPPLEPPQNEKEEEESQQQEKSWHTGLFTPGTFIISNHADELTAWTPLLAYLNQAPFLAIPCCSHDLSGARFRAPPTTKRARTQQKQHQNQSQQHQHQQNQNQNHSQNQDQNQAPPHLPQQHPPPPTTKTPSNPSPSPSPTTTKAPHGTHGPHVPQSPETGSLLRTTQQKSQPSAYATLCSYISSLTSELGYEAQREVLRIPSTRNVGVIGRERGCLGASGVGGGEGNREGIREGFREEEREERKRVILELVEREMGRSVEEVGGKWIERVQMLGRKPGCGH